MTVIAYTDKRSGIVKAPHRLDDPQHIVHLIGKVMTVSLETVKIVGGCRSKWSSTNPPEKKSAPGHRAKPDLSDVAF